MKRCPTCNRVEVDEALEFCRADGTPLVSDSGSVSESAGTMKFPSSQNIDTAATHVLPTGGAAPSFTANIPDRNTAPTTVLGAQRTPDSTQSLSKPKWRRTTFIVLAIVATFALAATGYLYFSRNSGAAINSIAVLPFQNASGDPNMDYLSDGVTESIINSLSRLAQLKVMARSTMFRFKGRQTDPQAVGKELGVGAVMTGRMLQQGDNLIVSVELVNVADGTQLWGKQYNRQANDLAAVQQEIARDISERLRLRLSGEERQLNKGGTSNTEAYQLYLRGRYYWNKRSADGIKKALEEFQQAIDRDPNYALAYVGLADCYLVLEQYAGTPASETLPKARAAVDRALQLEDSLAEAHTSSADIYQQQWRWAEAEAEYKRAIQLNPNYATAHHWYQLYLRAQGRFDEALAEIKRAQELDPLSPILAVNIATVYISRGDLDSAMKEAQRLVELDPNFPLAHEPLGSVYLKQHRYTEAIAAFQQDVASDGTAYSLSNLGYAYAVAGRRDEALTVLKELEEKYKRRESLGVYLALVYAGLGDKDQAFAWLEKDFQDRSGLLANQITGNPILGTLRGDARYADLLHRMGLRA